jgi:CHAD domain-containing protein
MQFMSKEDTIPPSMLAYADELVNKLREMLPAAIKDHDEDAIHDARVATRRLKAAVDVFEPISSKSHRREFEKTLRRLRKHLGPARDLDVMLGHVKEIKSNRLNPAAKWLESQLLGQQAHLRQSEAEKFDVAKALARLGAWWGVRQDWADAQDGLDCLISESLHLQLDRFAEHANAISGQATNSGDEKLLDPHQLRIAGKALRYTMEMAIAGGHKLPVAVGRSFKKMQDALGLWHDYVVLNDCVLELSVKTGLGHSDPAVAELVLDIAKLAIRQSAIQLTRFNKMWMKKGEALANTIRQAFPLTHPVEEPVASESKTDPDPPGSKSPPAEVPEADRGEPSAA